MELDLPKAFAAGAHPPRCAFTHRPTASPWRATDSWCESLAGIRWRLDPESKRPQNCGDVRTTLGHQRMSHRARAPSRAIRGVDLPSSYGSQAETRGRIRQTSSLTMIGRSAYPAPRARNRAVDPDGNGVANRHSQCCRLYLEARIPWQQHESVRPTGISS